MANFGLLGQVAVVEDFNRKTNAEYEYFNLRRDELVKKYHGKHVIVSGYKIEGIYNTFFEAYEHAIETKEVGEFLIQQCVTVEEEAADTTFDSGNVVLYEEAFD